MNEPEHTVELAIPTGALVRAIGQLAIHYPLVSHADAWRTLTAELSQRELRLGPDRPIVLARQHYDALPFDVKIALRETKP
jgi:hypothetical protein